MGLFLLAACSGGGGGGAATSQNGSLSLGLTDATTTDYQAVYITIKEVKVSKIVESEDEISGEDIWTVVATPDATYNLLDLVNGVIQHLGITDLEAGQYNQMRLVLGNDNDHDESLNLEGEPHPFANYIIYGDDSEYIELTIPSGFQSGFKIVGGFTIEADQLTDLVLDFNVLKSIVQAGASGKWLLKPTVKALNQQASASISGVVSHEDVPLEGAIVSAQITSGEEEIEIVTAATVTDETGEYQLLVGAGTYNLVAIMPGYQTSTTEVTIEAGDTAEQDFQMEAAVGGMGTIYGSVNILNGDDDQSVAISIRDEDGVEVKSASVANGGTYWFDLPTGVYSMVAIFTVDGEEMTLEAKEAFEIHDGTVIEFDIWFEDIDEKDDDTDDPKPGKVTICHKGREITISSSAFKAHLNHGDSEGSCDVIDDDGDVDDDSDTEEPIDEDGPDDSIDNGNPQKVTICHKGRQITVSDSAVDPHLKHGDTIGKCGSDTQGGDDEEDPVVD